MVPLAVLASDINWYAYNSFGGCSNYIHADCFPATPTINSRLELKRYTENEHRTYNAETYAPLSLERPDPYNHIDEAEGLIDPIAGCAKDATWPRPNGVCSAGSSARALISTCTRRRNSTLITCALDQYKVLVLSTHPEGWSKEMYFRLKQWAFELGWAHAMYLGGNGLDCEVEFLGNHRIVYHNTNWSHSEPQFAARRAGVREPL